ncbi:transposase [Candidatus Allofournierella merdipullorum]|uniref:transposase n=1 Tax=Candidatus Allofournierella merdipullorum TaxID=2838595 RepID=UPI002A8A4822|nr:hypothetical protein [Candidatus Fournierella merdipullorum]
MLTSEQIGEIRTAYREAANPKKQIGILADLYCTTKQEIRKVLGLPETSKKERRSYGAEEKEKVVKAVVKEGLSHRAAAKRCGVPRGNVAAWVAAEEKRGERQ